MISSLFLRFFNIWKALFLASSLFKLDLHILPDFFPLQPFQSELHLLSFDKRVLSIGVNVFCCAALNFKSSTSNLWNGSKKKRPSDYSGIYEQKNVGGHLPHSRPGYIYNYMIFALLKVKYVLFILYLYIIVPPKYSAKIFQKLWNYCQVQFAL